MFVLFCIQEAFFLEDCLEPFRDEYFRKKKANVINANPMWHIEYSFLFYSSLFQSTWIKKSYNVLRFHFSIRIFLFFKLHDRFHGPEMQGDATFPR